MTGFVRTEMLWPVELKQRVHDIVGARGLTRFTLEAVVAKLSGLPPVTLPANAMDDISEIELEPPAFSAEITAKLLRNKNAPTAPTVLEPEKEEEPPAPHSDACPNCYAPLIDGVCWACSL